MSTLSNVTPQRGGLSLLYARLTSCVSSKKNTFGVSVRYVLELKLVLKLLANLFKIDNSKNFQFFYFNYCSVCYIICKSSIRSFSQSDGQFEKNQCCRYRQYNCVIR